MQPKAIAPVQGQSNHKANTAVRAVGHSVHFQFIYCDHFLDIVVDIKSVLSSADVTTFKSYGNLRLLFAVEQVRELVDGCLFKSSLIRQEREDPAREQISTFAPCTECLPNLLVDMLGRVPGLHVSLELGLKQGCALSASSLIKSTNCQAWTKAG